VTEKEDDTKELGLAEIKEVLKVIAGSGGYPALGLAGVLDDDVLDAMVKTKAKKSRSKTRYYDQEGAEITADEWRPLQKAHGLHAVFQNPKIRIQLLWHGIHKNADMIPKDQAPLWEVVTSDRIMVVDELTGVEKEKFTDAESVDFWRKEDATATYNELVAKWTESYIDDGGKLHEVGNELAPPDPDKPSAESAPSTEVW
jgi:hypothetical protein